jgi:hypothetical protein
MKPRPLVAALLVASLLVASLASLPSPAAAQTALDPAPTPTAAPTPTPAPTLSHPPAGRAAPPTEAATRGAGPLRAGLEAFADYTYRHTAAPGAAATWFHAFDVPRVHAAVEGVHDETLRGRVVLEAVRSASEGALLGVSGDSLVIRVREAYGAYRPIAPLELTAGVLPTLTVPELDGTWMLRAVAPSVLEQSGLASPADLGAKARLEHPDGYGWVAVAATNGEGYTSRELNRGKSLEGAFELHPFPAGALLPLGVFASYTAGSVGTASVRADRLASGVVWQGTAVRAGAFLAYAWGIAQAGTQQGAAGTAFLRVEPRERLLLGARVDVAVRDVTTGPADAISTVWLTAGYRIAEPAEVFLAGTRALPTARAEAEVPGADTWSLRVIARVVF